jgi:hypothetical protein
MTQITPARGVSFWRVFGIPILLALASAIGLLSALFGDGVWDVLSWVALGAPTVVVAWYVMRPARGQRTMP